MNVLVTQSAHEWLRVSARRSTVDNVQLVGIENWIQGNRDEDEATKAQVVASYLKKLLRELPEGVISGPLQILLKDILLDAQGKI